MYSKLKNQFEEACNLFIRPPKHEYELEELGKNPLIIKNITVKRDDLILLNPDNKRLQCSFFQIQDDSIDPKPCIIYLHCNAGSRCEVLPLLNYLVTIGINVFSFDMSGCGLSEGDYVTLGYKEAQDVKVVVDYLRITKKASSMGLWGRSMGAVTALKYSEIDNNISVLIIDSPFSNLNKLAMELAKEKTGIPNFILPIALGLVKKGIKQKVDIKFGALDLTKFVNKIKIPACFIFSFHDEIIKPYHVEKLFELYGSPEKKLLSVKGHHNDARPSNIMKELGKFCFDQFLKKDEIFKKRVSRFETLDIYSKCSKILEKPNLDMVPLSNEVALILKKESIFTGRTNFNNDDLDCEVSFMDEEFPRLLSNVSLLTQNDAKFLTKEDFGGRSPTSKKSKYDLEGIKKIITESEENSKANLLTSSRNLKSEKILVGLSPIHKMSNESLALNAQYFNMQDKSFEIKVVMN